MTAFPFLLHRPFAADATAAGVRVVSVRTGLEVSDGGSYQFGPKAVGAGGVETFRIANTGNENLTISAAVADGDFSLPDDPGGQVVPPGEDFDLDVEVDTSGAGSKAGSLQVSSNAPGESAEFTLDLSGSVFELLEGGDDDLGADRGMAGGFALTGEGPSSMN